jgi:DNA uptake protein ComE-like DNA-binding protein
MMRLPNARFATLACALTLSLLAAACASGGEKAQSNTAATNAGAANTAATNPAAATNVNAAAATNQSANAPAGQGAGAKLNLNTATREEFLAKVPNLGSRMAHEFEEYRPYRSIQQFRKEMAKYVPADKIAEYERHIFVPVSENETDAATLQQIPGIDEKEAGELVAGRPYASREAFLAKLSEKVSPEELAAARAYLSNR